MRIRIAATLCVLAVSSAPAQDRQTAEGYKWAGKIPAGHWIMIRNLNGSITVGAATGDNVEVVATKSWRRGDSAVVHFDLKKYGSDNENVLICALWGSGTTCDEHHSDGASRNDPRTKDSDVSVAFQIRVPRGVKVSVNTVNGAVAVNDATTEVQAATVNGSVSVATSGGPVNATTVNGSVRAQFGHVDPSADMRLTTVNGSVTAEFTSDFAADVDLSTTNGSVNTNFPVTVSGRLNPKRLQTHIGAPGGPHIQLHTVNGSVKLQKR